MMIKSLLPSEVVALDQRIHQFIGSDLSEINELPGFMFDLLDAAENDSTIADSVLFENLDRLFIRLVVAVACESLKKETITQIRSSISRGIELNIYESVDFSNTQLPKQWRGYLKVVDALCKQKFCLNEP